MSLSTPRCEQIRRLGLAIDTATDPTLDKLMREFDELTGDVLNAPVRSWSDVIERAELAYHKADKNPATGELSDVSEDPTDHDRAIAELINAVRAMAKQ